MTPHGETTLTSWHAPRTPRRKRDYVRIIVGIVIVLAFPIIKLYFPLLLNNHIAFYKGTAGQTFYVSPKGWILQFPDSWDAQSFSEFQRGGPYRLERHGVLLSNMKQPFKYSPSATYEFSWFRSGQFPSRLVLLNAGFSYGGGFGIFCATDTELPLTLKGDKHPTPLADSAGRPVIQVGTRFSVGGMPYNYVSVMVGSEASAADIETMEKILQSIAYERTGDREYGSHDCSDGVLNI